MLGITKRFGSDVNGAKSWGEVITLAGMDFEVEKRGLFAANHDSEGFHSIDSWGIFRTDNQDFLGAVGRQYTPIQTRYCFDFVDTILSSEEGCHYETAGILGRGEKFWVQAKVPFDYNVDGVDPHKTFLLFASSHDGSIAAIAKLVSVRIICENTFNAALRMKGDSLMVKHTREAEERLEEAKSLMQGVVTSTKEIQDKLTYLSHRMISNESIAKVLAHLFPSPTGKLTSRLGNILTSIKNLFDKNDADQFPQFRGTAYTLFNSITNYVDHERSTRNTSGIDRDLDELRFESATFGSGALLKAQALAQILKESQNAPIRPSPAYVDLGASIN